MGARRLVVRVVELADVLVPECLLDGEPFARVELQELPDEIECVVTGRREEAVECFFASRRKTVEHGRGEVALNGVDIFLYRSAGELKYAIELVEGGGARENRLANEHFSKDTPQAPHVHSF